MMLRESRRYVFRGLGFSLCHWRILKQTLYALSISRSCPSCDSFQIKKCRYLIGQETISNQTSNQRKQMKATDRHITCVDCGEEFVGHYNKKRCSSCCKEHSRKKQREYALKYYYQDREAHLIRHREWLKKNKEHCAMYSVEYRKKRAKENPNWRKEMPSQHPDRVRAWSKKYYEEHKEDYARRDKESRQRNPERLAIRAAKRRALRASAVLPTTDNSLIDKMFKKSAALSKRYGVQYEIDHIIPLSKGGAHHQDNLRIIKSTDNKRKSASIIPDLGGVWADNDLARETKRKLTKGNK